MSQSIGFGRRIGVTLVVAIGLGLVVGLVAALVEFAMAGGTFALTPAVLVHVVLAGALGGVLAGFFGRGGVLGWLLALALGALVTALASFAAPILGPEPDLASAQSVIDALPKDLADVQIDAFTLPLALIASPFLGLFWVALVSAVHAAAGGARQG